MVAFDPTVAAVSQENNATVDKFGGGKKTLSDPCENAIAVTPSDTVPLSYTTTRLYIGVAGDVTVIMAGDGGAILFKAVPAGTMLNVRVSQVKATGTAATNIVALW